MITDKKMMYRAVLVDDEPFVIEGLKAAIDWAGANFEIVYSSTDPVSVLTYIKEGHPVDLLITDISMPGLSGLDLIRLTKEVNPLITILVLSAYDNFEYVRTALRNGAENYLLKPLDPNELSESISSITEHLKERSSLSTTYGSSMLTFRSIFIENWVKGSLEMEDFLTRAELLGINLQLHNYTVLLFSAPEADADGMARLFDYLLSTFVGNFQSHFYFETSTCLVCILSSREDQPDMETFLSSLNPVRQKLSFPFFVSVGHTVDNYEEVTESYRNAHHYLFLGHTTMPSYICESVPQLSISATRTIEQNFSKVSMEDYWLSLSRLLTPEMNTRQRMEFQLAVLNHGLSQTDSGKTEPQIQEKLKELLCDTKNYPRLLAYLKSFVETCYEILARRQEFQTNTYPYVDTVIQAVHDFSNKEISLKTLASSLDMNPSYLGNIFHQQTGYYFNDYLNEERLKYAAELMETTPLKLKDIVDKAGFSSQTYFNRLFKRRFGMSPLSYRREMKLKNGD
jgi:two-component system response regulator YesN